MTNLLRSPPKNQSKTDLGIVNESQLLGLGIRHLALCFNKSLALSGFSSSFDAPRRHFAKSLRFKMYFSPAAKLVLRAPRPGLSDFLSSQCLVENISHVDHRGRDINDELPEVEVTQALARTDQKFGII
jgi:hypothetical protein